MYITLDLYFDIEAWWKLTCQQSKLIITLYTVTTSFNPLNPIVHFWLHHTAHCSEKIVSARLRAGSAWAKTKVCTPFTSYIHQLHISGSSSAQLHWATNLGQFGEGPHLASAAHLMCPQCFFVGNSTSLEDQPTSPKGFVWCLSVVIATHTPPVMGRTK